MENNWYASRTVRYWHLSWNLPCKTTDLESAQRTPSLRSRRGGLPKTPESHDVSARILADARIALDILYTKSRLPRTEVDGFQSPPFSWCFQK